MYLNWWKLLFLILFPRLIRTWDVFKYMEVRADAHEKGRLIRTWDVFKSADMLVDMRKIVD